VRAFGENHQIISSAAREYHMCGAIINVIFERGGRRPCARVNPAPR
jgi:hypothetical protein